MCMEKAEEMRNQLAVLCIEELGLDTTTCLSFCLLFWRRTSGSANSIVNLRKEEVEYSEFGRTSNRTKVRPVAWLGRDLFTTFD